MTSSAFSSRQEMPSRMSHSTRFPSSFRSSQLSFASELSSGASRYTTRLSDRCSPKRRKPYRTASKRSLLSIANSFSMAGEPDQPSVPEGMEIFIERCENVQKTAVENVKRVEQNHAAVLADVRKFRRQINNVLDVWEKEVTERVNDIMDVDIANLKSVMEETANISDNIQDMNDEVSEYQRKLVEINVIETEAKNTFREYKFIGNNNISNLLKMEHKIGEIEITNEVSGLYNNLKEFDSFVPTYLEEINVKSDIDTFDCDITGMVMIGSHKLVVTDTDNRSVKSIDTQHKKITCQLTFASGPWDITVVHRGQLAVTFPSEKIIQYVTTTGGLTKHRHMKVQGECHGIAYHRKCLIVSFRSPAKVQIMSLQGHILKTMHLDVDKNKLFVWPDYVAVSRDGSSLYVSDWQRNTVTRLSWKGAVTGVYRDEVGTKMAGIAVGLDGCIYVCKRTSHSIVKLSPDCRHATTILEEKHGLKFPWTLCFCDQENKLYVDSNRNSNTVAVFELR